MAPENQCLEDEFSFSDRLFSRAFADSFRECTCFLEGHGRHVSKLQSWMVYMEVHIHQVDPGGEYNDNTVYINIA